MDGKPKALTYKSMAHSEHNSVRERYYKQGAKTKVRHSDVANKNFDMHRRLRVAKICLSTAYDTRATWLACH